jgi:hypothetical protein
MVFTGEIALQLSSFGSGDHGAGAQFARADGARVGHADESRNPDF